MGWFGSRRRNLVITCVALVLFGVLIVSWYVVRVSTGDGLIARKIEFGIDRDAVRAIIDGAGAAGRDGVRSEIRADWWLIPLYVVTLGLWCWIGMQAAIRAINRRMFSTALRVLAIAAAADVVGNLALDRHLSDSAGSAWHAVGIVAAWAKWTSLLFVAACAVGIATVAVSALIRRILGGVTRPEFDGAITGRATGTATTNTNTDIGEPIVDTGAARYPIDADDHEIGIGLSGGGIRAAAFSLGAMQIFQDRIDGEQPLYERADVLATVSGGGYIGTGIQLLRHANPSRSAFAPDSEEYRLLRDRQRYLWGSPVDSNRAESTREFVTALVVFAAGIIFNIALVLTVLFVMVRPLGWLVNHWVEVSPTGGEPTLVGLLGGMAAVGVVLYIRRRVHPLTTGWRVVHTAVLCASIWLAAHYEPTALRITGVILVGVAWLTAARWRGRVSELGLTIVWSVVVMAGGVLAWYWVDVAREIGIDGRVSLTQLHVIAPIVAALATAIMIAAPLRVVLERFRSSRNARTVVGIGIVVPLICLVGVLLWWVLYGPNWQVPGVDWQVWLVHVSVLVLIYFVLDQKRWSPHSFYKRRLAHAFAYTVDAADGVRPLPWRQSTTLSDIAARPVPGPELVLCGALYDTLDDTLSPPVQPFTFSSNQVGGPGIGYCRTVDFEAALGYQNAPDGTLLAAMAISGAAVSPAIGAIDLGPASSLISFANARLGVWLPNPQYVNDLRDNESTETRSAPAWLRLRRFSYLLKEIGRSFDTDGRFVYVTDGGQYDNLGLLELMRRRCRTIVLVDASGDNKQGSPLDVDTFVKVQQIAVERYGISFPDGDLTAQLTNAAGSDKPAVWAAAGELAPSVESAVVEIPFKYPGDPSPGPGDEEYQNRIVYVKAVLTDPYRQDKTLVDYLERSTSRFGFPAHSTLDQWLDPDQFDAYVQLGRLAAADAVATVGPTVP